MVESISLLMVEFLTGSRPDWCLPEGGCAILIEEDWATASVWEDGDLKDNGSRAFKSIYLCLLWLTIYVDWGLCGGAEQPNGIVSL